MSATLPATGTKVATVVNGSGEHIQVVDTGLAQPVTAAQLAALTLQVEQADAPLPAGAATETTLAAVSAALATINAAAQAIKTAAEALNGKTTAVNTGSIAGTVALDGPTLAALETISVAGVATESTLAAIAAAVKTEDTPAVSGESGIPMLAMRQLADTTSTDSDGDYTLLKIDEEGRVKVATKPASFDLVTGNITANAQSVFCDVRRASNVQVHMVAASLVGHNVTFEGSIDSTNGTDGNWFAIQFLRSNANTIELTSGVLAATPAYGWEASVNGLSFLRVRATAHTSGTATWKFQRGSYATEPIPAAQVSGTQPVSGTVTANQGTLVTPTPLNFTSAASTNTTSVKASAGTLYNLTIASTSASARYLKLYNKASAPVIGTDVPIMTVAIAAGASFSLGFGATGHRFATGIALALTGAAADADTTVTAANEVRILGSYI